MNALYALIAVLVLVALGLTAGQVESLRWVFGVVLPSAAIVTFLGGIVLRVLRWSRAPVPFRITATCGQQQSLPWIRQSKLDCPSTTLGVIGRMALEILLFRSLFRNTKAELRDGPRLVYREQIWLWLAALAFHWSFLIIFLRHLRFFVEPVPAFVTALATIDAFFQVGTPVLYATGLIAPASLLYLVARRLLDPRIRYISLFTDYFALFLLVGLVISGLVMRYFARVDVIAVKQMAIGLVTLTPVVPQAAGALFFVHLLLLTTLIAYFPFSKLVHMPGVFLSPTRNLANNNRARRHINPWNAPVKVHTYEEWEEEFHDKIVAAGLPLDKD
jgi:nitrate reductase gamma subunit